MSFEILLFRNKAPADWKKAILCHQQRPFGLGITVVQPSLSSLS